MESTEEDVLVRHRRELRELQGRITNKKKNATKKTRRGVLEECAALERALHERQEAELRDREGEGGNGDEEEGGERGGERDDVEREDDAVGGVAAQLADATLAGGDAAGPETPPSAASPSPGQPLVPGPPNRKRNRQRERLARRAAALEQDQTAAAAEAATMVDHAAVERAGLAPLLARSGRAEHAIRPDGHCLFAAVADQMAQLGRSVTDDGNGNGNNNSAEPYRLVRRAAAHYMETHPDDFAPFLVGDDDDDNNNNNTNGGLPAHIARIRDTAEWGGQLELRALASTYNVDIRVLHDGRSELIRPAGADEHHDDNDNDNDNDKLQQRPTLWLVYYRHGFGLGEHYNSLRSKTEEP